MSPKEIYEVIEKAINEKSELVLTVKHGLGDTIADTQLQGYRLGHDTYQYDYVWGYLPDLNLYYKFLLDQIVAAKATNAKYTVREDACYQYAIEEETFAQLDGFTNIYVQAARHANQ